MRLLMSALLLALPLFGNVALAHEETLGRLVGEHVDLAYGDHAMAGVIGGHIVFASPPADVDGGFIKLTHRAEGRDFESVLKKDDIGISSVVSSVDEDGKDKHVSFKIVRVDGQAGQIDGEVNGEVFRMQITADSMDGHHYVNPTFTVSHQSKILVFKLEGSSACIGCSAKISYVVLSMLKINGKI